MEKSLRIQFDALWSSDRDSQNSAFHQILNATEQSIGWVYEVWYEVVANLSHADIHNRAIASQVLCNLAISDPDKRILKDFHKLLTVTKDKRFVTARHTLQALWKIGQAGKEQRGLLVDSLQKRFDECIHEKNCTLIRFDIIQGMTLLYDAVGDEMVKTNAFAWINRESDPKYQKKYAKIWKNR